MSGQPQNGAAPRRGLAAFGVDWKRLPHNFAAETSIIGGILLDSAALAELDELEVDDFHDARCKIVWQAIRNLQARAEPIDPVTLEVEIERQGKLDSVGGQGFIGTCALNVPTASNVIAYATEVRRSAANRRAIIALASATDRALNWQHDPRELVLEIAGELQRFDTERGPERAAKTRWCVPLDAFLGDEEPSDDDAEDWIIRDIVPRAESVMLAGQMKGGKTWAALHLLVAIALGRPWMGFENTLGAPAPVTGVFLEDNKRRLSKRLWEICRGYGTSPNDKLLRQNLHLSRAPLRLPDREHQRRFVTELKATGSRVALIDNLTRVMVGDPNKTTDAASFTRAWMEIIDESGCSTGFLHHTKKPSGDQTNVDPFDTLRGSGDFGAAARNIIVMKPIAAGDGEKLSELRMRGNLDLRRESFVLGFDRKHHLDRWHVYLHDRGEVDQIKDEAKKAAKENKQKQKREDLAAEMRRRRETAIAIAKKEGAISSTRLALEFGLASGNAVAPILRELVKDGLLTSAGKRGYELVRDQADLHL